MGKFATKSKSAGGKPGVLRRPAAGNSAASQTVPVRESESSATKKRGRGSDSEPVASHAAIATAAKRLRDDSSLSTEEVDPALATQSGIATAAKRLRDDSSLSTEEVDPALATQSGIAKGRTAGQVDGSDPESDSDLFLVRILPTGFRMCDMISKPFEVAVHPNERVRDLKKTISSRKFVHHRIQSI